MNESSEIMRCEINGQWTAEEMAYSFLHMRDLYNLRLTLQIVAEEIRDLERFYFEAQHFFPTFRRFIRRRGPAALPFLFLSTPPYIVDADLDRFTAEVFPSEKLIVRRVEFGSPGFKDLLGIGEVLEQVKDFILKLMERKDSQESRRLINEEQALKNQQLRIENALKLTELAERCGYTKAERRKMVNWVDERQETFVHLIDAKKMTGVKIIDQVVDNREEK